MVRGKLLIIILLSVLLAVGLSTPAFALTLGTVTIETDIDDTVQLAFAFVVAAFIISCVFANMMFAREKSPVLKAIGTVVCLVYGFNLASGYSPGAPLWVAGVAIGLLGLFFLYSTVIDAYREWRARGE